MKQLLSTSEEVAHITELNEFSIYAIEARNNNERISARYLREALLFSSPNKQLFNQALDRVNFAKNLTPAYIEVYRVGAFIKARNHDLLEAEED